MENFTPLSEFEALASQTGISLPPLLKNLLAFGKTAYGSDWSATWRERMLAGGPAFICWYDFEWLDAADARREVGEWLNPEAQDGKRFLPFAQSGAGDAYCLMPVDENSVGVALIFHDRETSRMIHRSFEDFVIAGYLECFANLDHLADDDFSEDEILQCLKADVHGVTALMTEKQGAYLRSLCEQELAKREFHPGPKARPEHVLSLISQEQLEKELAAVPMPDLAPFSITAAWEL
ncbi:SMI1/KNR4 family protein [Massilia sp. BJB1822]|uniref:SMI1/KNR4 family protein n=1 Tax=Massilia sp. BJB1822 TaxID=2744470 RepID=UPI001593375B|nr:SMI1/KNR4 family protein [Massilia sp. BJB1822]NVE01448.1 SMI1/KNR4 family protein [Massilia sp. BJB1822]